MSADPASHPSQDPPLDAAPARLSQRLRRRLAALSAVGALMVVLPLVQVLRYQNAELQTLIDVRASLDPAERAVHVERALIAHRDIASAVLAGSLAREPERRLRQGEVDDRLAALSTALAAGHWDSAGGEADALRADWSLLVRQVLARELDAAGCDRSHRLLVEQTLQVIDLVGDFAGARAALGGPAASPLQSRLAVLHSVPHTAAHSAWQRARKAADPASPQAQWQAYDDALAAARNGLAADATQVRQRRDLLLAALVGLATAAAALLLQLWRGLRGEPPAPPEPPDDPAATADDAAGAPSLQRAEAGRLLARLRAPPPGPHAAPTPQRLP